MNRSTLNVGLSNLKKWHEKNALRYDLSFQRHTGMWSLPAKSMLVWSILSDSYIQPLIFVKNDEDVLDERGKSMSAYSVLDGAQRTTNLFSFMNDEFRLHGCTMDAEIDGEIYELAGKLFSELPQDLQNAVNAYKFNIQVIANATEEEQTILYANINSGVPLSIIQRAKPELGVDLCSYFAGVVEKPFFSQGLNMTAAQALREEDLCMALQSLMLMSDYDGYKSVSVAECLKFASYLKNNFNKKEQENFLETVDYLGVFDKKAKYLRKNNVCVIVRLAEQMLCEGIEPAGYKAFLNEFFASDNEGYREFSGSGNVKRPNVEARYKILRDECYRYFKLELPEGDENSEAMNDSSSPEAEQPNGGGSGDPENADPVENLDNDEVGEEAGNGEEDQGLHDEGI